MRRFVLALMLASVWVLQPWVQNPESFAATSFDSAVQPVETLTVQCYDFDTSSWSTSRKYHLEDESLFKIFKDEYQLGGMPIVRPTEQRFLDFLDDIDDRVYEGSGWATVQMTPHNGTQSSNVGLVVNTGSNQGAVFANDGQLGQPSLRALNANGYSINCHNGNDGQFKVYVGTIGVSQQDYWWADGAPIAVFSKDGSDYHPYIVNMPVAIPSGYEGNDVPSTKPTVKYVAMGDSYSSGEGNEPFEYDTDTVSNTCHRSVNAYPRILQSNLDLGATAFVACSGATTSNILTSGQWGEPAQIDALSADTEVVTITIGGNDINFAEFAKKCVSPINVLLLDGVCDEFTDIYDEVTGLITNSLPAKLEATYTALLEEAPNAEIYVGSYPLVSPYKSIEDPFDNNCGGLYDEIPNNWGDARAAYEVVNLLDDAIADAVNAVNTSESSTRLHFVDARFGEFLGHDVCSDDRYFTGIDYFNPEYSVHPDYSGHQAYASDFEEAIN